MTNKTAGGRVKHFMKVWRRTRPRRSSLDQIVADHAKARRAKRGKALRDIVRQEAITDSKSK